MAVCVPKVSLVSLSGRVEDSACTVCDHPQTRSEKELAKLLKEGRPEPHYSSIHDYGLGGDPDEAGKEWDQKVRKLQVMIATVQEIGALENENRVFMRHISENKVRIAEVMEVQDLFASCPVEVINELYEQLT